MLRRLVLVLCLLALGLTPAAALGAAGQRTSTHDGAVSAITATAITVGGGGRSATCLLAAGSPSVSSVSVGERVRISCRKHILVALTPRASAPASATTPAATALTGTIAALGSTSLSVRDGKHTVTCTLAKSSPSVAGYAVGAHVNIGCTKGVLAMITPDTTLVTTPEQLTPTGAGAGASSVSSGSGTVTALSAASITVTSGPHSLTCSLGPNAASTSGVAVGDSVRISCLDGLLYSLIGPNGTSVSPLGPTTATAS